MIDKKLTVGIFFGGKSPEHEVSVITGLQVLNKIDREKYDVVPVYVAKNGRWYSGPTLFYPEAFKDLSRISALNTEVFMRPNPKENELRFKRTLFFLGERTMKLDVIFPCFHGGQGEGGGFQGLFELIQIPYVGSGVLGSALGMDKVVMKQLLSENGVKVSEYEWFREKEWKEDKEGVIRRLEGSLGYPMFVKPAVGGSSIGVSKAGGGKELLSAVKLALTFDKKVIVEKEVSNAKEINVSVLGSRGSEAKVSVCEQVFATEEFLNFEQKYVGKGKKSEGMASTNRQIPAQISSETQERVQAIAKRVFAILSASGLARVDFLLSSDEKDIYVTEINTIPGSMSFYLWEGTGVDFKDVLNELIEIAIFEHKEKSGVTINFQNNLLENFGGSLKGPKLKI